jgi:hypothetical protein
MLAIFCAAVIKCIPLIVALTKAIGKEMYNNHRNIPLELKFNK